MLLASFGCSVNQKRTFNSFTYETVVGSEKSKCDSFWALSNYGKQTSLVVMKCDPGPYHPTTSSSSEEATNCTGFSVVQWLGCVNPMYSTTRHFNPVLYECYQRLHSPRLDMSSHISEPVEIYWDTDESGQKLTEPDTIKIKTMPLCTPLYLVPMNDKIAAHSCECYIKLGSVTSFTTSFSMTRIKTSEWHNMLTWLIWLNINPSHESIWYSTKHLSTLLDKTNSACPQNPRTLYKLLWNP